MPTPIAPGIMRAQCIFQGRSGLPEDRYVNTFHFSTIVGIPTTPPEEAEYDAIGAALNDFYTGTHAPATGPLTQLMSGVAIDQGAGLQIRMYHLGDPEPREPHIRSYPLSGIPATDAFPNEVALCLSFYSQRNLPSQRGRIYLGPLVYSTNTKTLSTEAGDMLPAAEATGRLREAALALMAAPDTDWVVYSPTKNTGYPVTSGWVDNRFDTQRRRGTAPSSRVTF